MKPENNKFLQQFLKADVLVVSAPMYNFAIPSQLKSWFDHIVIAGQTFKYGSSGLEGLAKGKKVFIISSRGGFYSDEGNAMDHQEAYLKVMFGFMGIDDVTIVRAESLGTKDKRKASIKMAMKEIEEIKIIVLLI